DNYFRILTEHDPFDVTALSRVGQMLFTAGRTEEGVLLLERAVTEGDVDAEALLFLGNGYYTLEDWEAAIDTWTAYVEAVGPEEAGRVPGLIEDAETRLAGGEPEGSPELPATPADAGVPVPADDGQQASTGQTDDVTDATRKLQHSAESLFTANGGSRHAAGARGGTATAPPGTHRSAHRGIAENTIRFGRGAMPGFMATVPSEAIDD